MENVAANFPPPLPPVNPLGAPQLDLQGLAGMFHSIAHSLPPSTLARLKTIDVSRAYVTVRAGLIGQKSPRVALGVFSEDFALEAADLVKSAGKLIAEIDPNDGSSLITFSFRVDGVAVPAAADPNGPVVAALQSLQAEIEQLKQERELDRKLAQLGNQGGLEHDLDRLVRLQQVLQGMTPKTADPIEQLSKMGQALQPVMQGFGDLRQSAAKAFAIETKPPEKSFAQELKEVMEVPGAQDVFKQAVSRLFTAKESDAPAVLAENNAFARSAS